MKKTIVEFRRYPKIPLGYGLLEPPSDEEILDFLVEWCKLSPSTQIYKHLVSTRYENETTDYNTTFNMPIPHVDIVYYISIYHQ